MLTLMIQLRRRIVLTGWLVCIASMAWAEPGSSIGLLKRMPDEVMPDKYLRIKVDPLENVKSHTFTRDKTAPDWRQAMPIGNGDFGAAVHGYPDNLTFHIGKTDVWWDNKDPGSEYPSFDISEVRKRLASGDSASIRADLSKQHAKTKSLPNETTAARFTLQLHRSANFFNVTEALDICTATAAIRFGAGENGQYENFHSLSVESFVSRPAEVMVIRANLRDTNDLMGTVRFELSRDPMEVLKANTKWRTVEELDAKHQPRPTIEDKFVWFKMMLSGGDEYGNDEYVVMLACDSEKMKASAAGPEIFGRFRPDAGPVTFYITLVSNNDIRGPWADPRIKGRSIVEVAKERLRNALNKGYERIRQEHINWWSNYWQRSWVIFPEKRHEYPWYWSLYKAGSAYRPGKVAPAYGAPWRANNYVPWGFYTFNYEQIHYNLGKLPTNHAEQMEPILAVVHNTKDVIRKKTKGFYGFDGLCYPHAMSFRGHLNPWSITPMNVGTSGEAVKWAWEYYDFTGDKGFLREVGYPLLKGVADFYLDYLLEDENGRLYIFPSYWSELLHFHRNSITDLSMFHMVFRDASRAAEILGVDADRVRKWRKARERLVPFFAFGDQKKDVWKASEDRNELAPGEWPNLQMYPVAVAGIVDAWHGPEELRKQARASYEYGLGKRGRMWDKSISYIAAARMGDRAYAEKIFDLVLGDFEYGNLKGGGEWEEFWRRSYHVDIGSGFPAGVLTEFMLQSQGGDIRLFPATPLKGHYAFHSLRARGAFLVSSEFRGGKVPYALIQSLVGNPCRVVQPFGKDAAVQVRDLDTGKVVLKRKADADEILEFRTVAQHIYAIERQDVPLEKVPVINK